MTAAVSIALTQAEAEAIARANATLAWIEAFGFPWEHADSAGIKDCAEHLRSSLRDYAGLGTGDIHPAMLFPDLAAGHPDNAMEQALDRVTADIREWTRDLEALARAAEDAAYAREEGRML